MFKLETTALVWDKIVMKVAGNSFQQLPALLYQHYPSLSVNATIIVQNKSPIIDEKVMAIALPKQVTTATVTGP